MLLFYTDAIQNVNQCGAIELKNVDIGHSVTCVCTTANTQGYSELLENEKRAKTGCGVC